MNSPLPKNWRNPAIVLLVALTAIALVLYTWNLPPFHSAVETTENAYVRGSVTVVAPKVDGYVAEVLVQDFATVKAGDMLVRLDDRHYQQKLAQARAQLAAQEALLANVVQARRAREAGVANAEAALVSAEAQSVNAKAQLARARADERRASALVGDGSLSQREADLAEASLRQAEAAALQSAAAIQQASAALAAAQQELRSVIVNRDAIEANVAAARAAVQLAEIDLAYTHIHAPRDGQVGEVGVKLGQYVAPGTQLVALVPLQVWVVANFKEAQTAHMRVGQPALLQVDALAGAQIHGRIESMAPASGSEFSVIRPDNATGNFTKIPQRLPVRITIDPGDSLAARLRPGMSVLASVNTGGSRP